MRSHGQDGAGKIIFGWVEPFLGGAVAFALGILGCIGAVLFIAWKRQRRDPLPLRRPMVAYFFGPLVCAFGGICQMVAALELTRVTVGDYFAVWVGGCFWLAIEGVYLAKTRSASRRVTPSQKGEAMSSLRSSV